MHNGYFEAILQLRDQPEQIMAIVDAFLGQKNIQVAKEVKHKNGVDLYLSHQHAAQRLGNLLKQHGAQITVSKKIHTRDRQRSKDVYRVTILARFPNFMVGDVIDAGDKVVRVTKISKRLSGIDLATGKRVSLAVEGKPLEKLKTRVIATSPELMILDPETYQPETLIARAKLKSGEKVTVVKHHNAYYLLA
ncbi:MAG: hypothetical protein KJ709_02290 [Nanoarchaeota archaeon]|nr:hypothetical protein [Nanoarchaeota archaeon]